MLVGDRRSLAIGLPARTNLSARGSASARFAGLSGPTLPDPHHLDQWRPTTQLVRGVFSALALPVGTTAVVPAHPATGLAALPSTPGRRGHRRYAAAQDGPRHSAGLLSARSFVAAVSCQSGARAALLAGFAARTVASPRAGRHPRFAHSLSGSVARQAPRQESHGGNAETVEGGGEAADSVTQLRRDGKATQI